MDSHLESLHIRYRHPACVAMIVCVCRRVSDRDIARHAKAGLGFDEIQLELGVATQCGGCEGVARDVVAQCHGTCPTAHIRRQNATNPPREPSPAP